MPVQRNAEFIGGKIDPAVKHSLDERMSRVGGGQFGHWFEVRCSIEAQQSVDRKLLSLVV